MPPPTSPTRVVTPLMRDAVMLSVRLVARAHGAPKRCRRSTCRRTGRCHLVFDAEGVGFCPGGLTDAELDQAALMLVFLGEFYLASPRE